MSRYGSPSTPPNLRCLLACVTVSSLEQLKVEGRVLEAALAESQRISAEERQALRDGRPV
jgi:hypothetical protein